MTSTPDKIAPLPPDARRALLAKLLREKAGQPEPLPLSYAQERMWFLDALEPNRCLYNLPLALRLSGSLDVPALQKGIQEIVRRHEILRTTFVAEKESPVQVVAGHLSVNLPVLDLSSWKSTAMETEVNRLIHDAARAPFDLARGPLFRAHLLRLSPDEHVLILTLHHIICDAWSLAILLRELAALYGAFTAGQFSPLPDPEIQYGDFAVWQRRQLQGAGLARQLDYWMRQLEGIPNLLELPADRPRPAIQTCVGAHQSFVWPSALSQALKALSQREGVTLFMTALAALEVLLHRYTGQSDLVVGTAVANRNRREVEPLIGLFANTLVLRLHVGRHLTFRELLGRVRQVALDAYDHQEVPFEKLVEKLQPQRDLSHNPLFQVMLIFQSALPESLGLPGLATTLLPVHTGTSKFDLTLSVRETRQQLVGEVEYNTDIFEASTIARMLEHFQILAEGAAADPTRRLADLPLLSPPERQRILFEWNQTEKDYPRGCGLHQLFEAQAEKTPDQVALLFERQQLRYRELNERANELARRLRIMGVGPEVLVGLCVEPSEAMVIGMLAILKAGGAYLPLDPTYPKARLAFALADSQAEVLLTERKLVDRLPPHQALVLCLDAWEAKSNGAPAPRASVLPRTAPHFGPTRPESLAYVIYTSGSTGKPKGVCLEHRNAVALVAWAMNTYTADELRGVLASTSMCFDLSVFEVFVPLSCGGKVILAANLLRLPELPATDEVTLINTVPSAMAELLRLGGVPASVRAVNLAGEPLPAKLVRQIYESTLASRVFDLYGPTEDTVYSSGALRQPEGPVTIGRPLSNKQIYILDAQLQPVPAGVPGELCISGDGVGRGYLDRPDLTAEKFIPHPHSRTPGARLYRTGDLARHLPDGNVEFLGRKDHQVKVRGYRIELGEIEATLRPHPAIRECLVIARESAPGEKTLIAYIVPKDAERPVPEALRRFLAERLPGYMIPTAFVFLDKIPKTPNGKVDRRALPPPDPARSAPAEGAASPRTTTERVLAEIWSDVLGIEKIGVNDNFFDLGGHSLLVTRVVSRVRAAFEIEVPIRFLFEAPTIALLAGAIEKLLVQEIEERAEEKT